MNTLNSLQEEILLVKNKIGRLKNLTAQIQNNRSMRISELLVRLPSLRNSKGRSDFKTWIKGGQSSPEYQPLCQLHNELAVLEQKLQAKLDVLENCKKNPAPYLCLFLGTIDFEFLFQRPQHIAVRLAESGLPVFYISSDFGAVDKTKQGVYLRYPPDSIARCIQMCMDEDSQEKVTTWLLDMVQEASRLSQCQKFVLINQHPLWQNAAQAVRQQYPDSIIVVDYMDDYLDFPGADPALKPFVRQMLKESDLVIATSLYLEKKARQGGAKEVQLIRNGTESTHFTSAYRAQPTVNKPVVGYYGVLSDWFDTSKIEALSRSDLDIEIRLIGHIGMDTDKRFEKLRASPKVTIMDAVPYNKLPQELKDFDVCLIPFKADSDLIKATNPVKFYEYLSAGKPVVSTEIPELMPFRNQFVLCENEDEAFVEAVRSCLQNTSGLSEPEECIAFASENDWNTRAKQVKRAIETALQTDVIQL